MSEKLLAFQISGSHFKKWDSDSDDISSQNVSKDSVDECFDTIAKKVKENPKDKVKVAISTASDVDENFVLTANNYPIRDQQRGRASRFEFRTELEKTS